MTIHLKEETVNRAIRSALEALGYEVLSTTVRNARGGYGASRGVPDLLISRPGWRVGWLGMEVKGPKTPVSPEQARLAGLGLTVIVRSVDDALTAVRAFQETNGLSGPKFTIGGVRLSG